MNIFKNRGPLAFVAAMGVVLAGTALGLSSTASAQSNLVYVGSNIGSVPNMNSVFVFSNDGAGNLTQIAGSPFLSNGTGWYDPNLTTSSEDADNGVIIDPSGSYLYTVNSHSNTLSSFSIAAGGALTLISTTPYLSGGKEPVSLALGSNVLANGSSVLAVGNKGQDPNQPTATSSIQSLTGNGTMSPVRNGKITFPSGDYLASVNTTPLLPKYVFGIQLLGGSEIFTYKINSTGKLRQVSEVGPPSTGDLLLGMAFHPTQHVAYVGIPNGGAIAVYAYSGTGTMNLVTTVVDKGTAVCWFAINSAGTRLYAVENASGTISVYDTTTATAPVFLQQITLSNQPQAPTNIAIDPTGKFAYVIGGSNANDQGAPLLHVLNISQTDGTLTETVPAVALNIAQGEHAAGLATLLK